MPYFKESFTFNEGNLGRNLATLPERIHGFISRDLKVAASQGEVRMKTNAPWKDRTGAARAGLWANSDRVGDTYTLDMGHGVEYGIYLEKLYDGKNQIVMPTLVATAESFMESLKLIWAELDDPAPFVPDIRPAVRGTSQGAGEHVVYIKGVAHRDFTVTHHKVKGVTRFVYRVKGKFASISSTGTKRTRRTKRG